MDNKISIGDKIDLEKIDSRLSVAPNKVADIYTSQVLDEAPDGRMYAAMPIRGGTVIPLGIGQKFNATFYSDNGLLRCEVVVTNRGKKGSLFLVELEPVSALQKVQRREYYRYECRTPITYRIIEGEELQVLHSGEAFYKDDQEYIWKEATMLDLSGGGIRFVSTIKEDTDVLIQVRFEIDYEGEKEVIYAFAEVLRSEQNANNNSLYEHRITFWRMDSGMREKLIHYIFEEQRKKRSNQLK